MPIDFTALEPDGLQLHIMLNNLLAEYGFFDGRSADEKKEFDRRCEAIISEFLEYDDE